MILHKKALAVLVSALLAASMFPLTSFAEVDQSETGVSTSSSQGVVSSSPSGETDSLQEEGAGQGSEASSEAEPDSRNGSSDLPSASSAPEAPELSFYDVVEFVYVDLGELTSDGEQHIVIGYKEQYRIESCELRLLKEDGSVLASNASKISDNAALFDFSFGESDLGDYRLESLSLQFSDSESAETLSFPNSNDVAFTVLPGIHAMSSDSGIQTSVYALDGNTLVEGDDLADVAGAVGSVPAVASSKARSSKSGGFVVALDPGHGGSDNGASANGLKEDELNLKIASYCRDELEKYGFSVFMTRTSDKYVGLEERVELAADAGASLFVSFHINAGGGTGSEVWIPTKGTWYSDFHEIGADLGNSILERLEALGLKNRGNKDRYSSDTQYEDGSKADYLAVIRGSRERGIPAVLIEHGFIDNSSDASFMKSESNLKSMGKADAEGIIEQFGDYAEGRLVKDSKGYRFVQSDGSILKDSWKDWGGERYYFGSNGYALIYAQTIDGNRYYFNGSGELQTGWVTWKADGRKSYFSPSFHNGAALSGWQTVGGEKYYFDSEDENRKAARYETVIDGKRYYFDGSGALQTGWVTWNADGARTYFDPSNGGAALSGWQKIGGKTYYFDPERSDRGARWETVVDGRRYYFGSDCSMVTGLVVWKADGRCSLFGSDGAAVSGWQTVDGKKYYFDPGDGRCLIWEKVVDGKRYYFDGSGALQTGWVTWKADGRKSYFDPSNGGAAVIGVKTIDGKIYEFGEDGRLLEGYTYTIMGLPTVSVSRMVEIYNTIAGSSYPSLVYASKGASSIEEFCRIVYEEASAEGVRPDVVFSQAMLETGWLKFGGSVKPEQCNFAGLGAVSSTAGGASFSDVRTGIRAQVQHLKAYACTDDLVKDCVDPRFSLVKRGSAPLVVDLSGKWAVPGEGYGKGILDIIDMLKSE